MTLPQRSRFPDRVAADMDVVKFGGNMRRPLLALMIVALALPLAAAEEEEPIKASILMTSLDRNCISISILNT